MDEKNFVLPENGAPLRIAAILEKVLDMIDDYQESASSAGHADLSGPSTASGIALPGSSKLQADPEKAGTANQAFLTAIVGDARYMLRELAKWKTPRFWNRLIFPTTFVQGSSEMTEVSHVRLSGRFRL